MDEETIVLLTEYPRDDSEFIDRTSAIIMDTINAETLAKVRIGIGMVAESLKDAAKSYREASLALTVGNIFETDTYIMRYDKLGLGRLIYQLPPTLCHMFLDEVFPKGAYESLDSETLLTIQKFSKQPERLRDQPPIVCPSQHPRLPPGQGPENHRPGFAQF